MGFNFTTHYNWVDAETTSEIKNQVSNGFCWFQTNDGIIHFWITWSVQIQSVHVPYPFASARYLLSLGAMAFAILRRGCVLIEHVSIFLCKDGEVTTALLLIDGLHLSETGSKALLQNIGLTTRLHVLLGRGMRRNVPSKTHDTSHHKHQRGWMSSDSGGRLNKKDGLTRYGNSHVKDKTS